MCCYSLTDLNCLHFIQKIHDMKRACSDQRGHTSNIQWDIWFTNTKWEARIVSICYLTPRLTPPWTDAVTSTRKIIGSNASSHSNQLIMWQKTHFLYQRKKLNSPTENEYWARTTLVLKDRNTCLATTVLFHSNMQHQKEAHQTVALTYIYIR